VTRWIFTILPSIAHFCALTTSVALRGIRETHFRLASLRAVTEEVTVVRTKTCGHLDHFGTLPNDVGSLLGDTAFRKRRSHLRFVTSRATVLTHIA